VKCIDKIEEQLKKFCILKDDKDLDHLPSEIPNVKSIQDLLIRSQMQSTDNKLKLKYKKQMLREKIKKLNSEINPYSVPKATICNEQFPITEKSLKKLKTNMRYSPGYIYHKIYTSE